MVKSNASVVRSTKQHRLIKVSDQKNWFSEHMQFERDSLSRDDLLQMTLVTEEAVVYLQRKVSV